MSKRDGHICDREDFEPWHDVCAACELGEPYEDDYDFYEDEDDIPNR